MAFFQHHREHTDATMRTADGVQTQKAKFTTGRIWRHVSVMALTGSIGLVALFAVDLIDIYFLSLLGERSLAAAVGYAGTILFFTTSLAIGISITLGALGGKMIGAGKMQHAREYMWHTFGLVLLVSTPVAIGIWIFAPQMLHALGATGQTLDYATIYLRVIIPSLPILGLAMSANALLRAVGDAKRAMYATLWGGLINALLDPFFIFVLDMHIAGAALASVAARLTIFATSLWPLVKVYNFGGFYFTLAGFKRDFHAMWMVALPAIATNLATPIGNSYVVKTFAAFGDSAVAGFSVVGRVSMVAFAVLFALSGAVGPIIAQNYGAGLRDRVVGVIKDSAWFSIIYVTFASACLFFLDGVIIGIFHLTGAGAHVVTIFTQIISWTYIFSGFIFVANAACNNLDVAKYATLINFARATVFTIPFVYFGARYGGVSGVLIGQAVGSIIIGVIAFLFSLRVAQKMKMGEQG